jgi:putative integral membrane protein (TIGR02587 family)
MGMGLLITAVILWLLGRLEPQMSMEEIMGKIVVESLTVAIGISVGKAQLGTPGEDTEEENPKEVTKSNGPAKHLFGNHLVMAICGAVLVAANVAPTEEIVQIAVETAPYKLLIISLVSLGIGGMVLYYSDFKGSTKSAGKWDVFTGIVIMYTVSLLVSAFMLWFFGRFAGASLAVIMSETVVLAFPAALGASAGRLLLQT